MRLRLAVFALVGMVILGSAVATLVGSDCERCGSGQLECPACSGRGVEPLVIYVLCHCGGFSFCPLCHGLGHYPHPTTTSCQRCDGEGWIPCPTCGGDGKRSLMERLPDLWRGKPGPPEGEQ
ncbi:MAG TPA: hypothetical protein G4O03_08275 [Dehalococcoidia bacterium]|jgi:DnaJ-class molecular chaperone|nr:hypothetical protein [Dehalococcoidia bacterium]